MHLNIKNDEAHELATKLAKLTGQSLTNAVTTALRDQVEIELRRRGRGQPLADKIMEHAGKAWEWPDTGADPDEILGYDENGLPT